MTVQQYTINIATPPDDLPHKSRKDEILELREYITAADSFPEGTDRILVDGNMKDANRSRIYIERNELEAITGIYAYSSGAWKRWEITTDDISADALDTMLSVESDKLKVNLDGETLLLTEAVDGKQNIYAHPRVDGTTILYETVDEKEQLTAKQPLAYFQGKWIHEDFTLASPASWINAGNRTITKDFGSMNLTDDGVWVIVTDPGYYQTSLGMFVASFAPNTELVATVVFKVGLTGSEIGTCCQARYSNYNNGTDAATCAFFETGLQHITQSGAPVVIDFTGVSEDTPGYVRVKLVGNSTRGTGNSTGAAVTYHAYTGGEGQLYPYIGEATIIALYKIGDTLAS